MPHSLRFPRFYFYLLAGAMLGLDQASKFWAQTVLDDHAMSVVPGFFGLMLRGNTGIAFSLLVGKNQWLAGVTACLMTGAAYLVLRLRLIDWAPWQNNVAAALIAAGALGNWLDRVRLGYVVDFLDFYWRSHHYPTFNIADSGITVGVALLFWQGARVASDSGTR